MSDHDYGSGPDTFEKFVDELEKLVRRHPEINRNAEILIDLRDDADDVTAAETFGLAADERCKPPCKPGRQCVYNVRSRRWRCWPPF